MITQVHMGDRNVFLLAICVDPACRFGRKVEKRLNGGRGLRSGLELENLPKQGERDDDRGCFEVDADSSILNEGSGKTLGHECCRDAVKIGGGGT